MRLDARLPEEGCRAWRGAYSRFKEENWKPEMINPVRWICKQYIVTILGPEWWRMHCTCRATGVCKHMAATVISVVWDDQMDLRKPHRPFAGYPWDAQLTATTGHAVGCRS